MHNFKGYKQHEDDVGGSDGLYQKRILDEVGQTKYFINITKWDYIARGIKGIGVKYRVEVTLFPSSFSSSVNVSFDLTTVEEAEKFIEDFYIKNNCVPDLHNN